jgi:hypothetical protein
MYDSSTPHVSDLPLFLGRWCRATVEHDIGRFASSWRIDFHDPRLEHHREQLRMRRMRVIRYVRGGLHRTVGTPPARVEDAVEPILDVLARVRLPIRPGSSRRQVVATRKSSPVDGRSPSARPAK